MLSVDMGVDIHLSFLFGRGSWGIQFIIVYIYIMMYYTAYSV